MYRLHASIYAIAALLLVSQIHAQNPCRGVTAPSDAQGKYCFLIPGNEYVEEQEEIIQSLNNSFPVKIPELPSLVQDAIKKSCVVAGEGRVEGFDQDVIVPIGYVYYEGKWQGSPILGEDVCKTGNVEVPGASSSTPSIKLNQDHGRSSTSEAGSGGSDEKGCYSVDTDVIINGQRLSAGSLKAGDGDGQVLHVQHAERHVQKDVLCVKNNEGGVLCSTNDHVVKYKGERMSMGELCETVECYERKNVKVVNPIYRYGTAKSSLRNFELTDEVDWAYVPRIVTRVGARLLAEGYKFGESIRAALLFDASSGKQLL